MGHMDTPHKSAALSENWIFVHRQLDRAREALEEAHDVEQFQAVGLICREVMISLAKTVYVAERHSDKIEHGVKPSKSDAKRMLEGYVADELQGGSYKEARKFVNAAIDLANSLQHSSTADYEYAAMCVTATAGVVHFISITARRGVSRSTVGQLCERFIRECNPGHSHKYSLQALARASIGKKIAIQLQARDVLEHCRLRRKIVAGATVKQDTIYLRGVLAKAKEDWNINTMPEVVDQAKPELDKTGLTGRSTPRTRLPSDDEYECLMAYYSTAPKKGKARTIPMTVLIDFARWSARRISEICSLEWKDVNEVSRTCIVRNVMSPRGKTKRDIEVPLLGRAWDIVQAQPRIPGEPRIFPYNAKSASASYTLAKKRLGIPNLRFHDLRRDAARRLLKAGHPLPDVLRVVGRIDVRPVMKELGLA